MADFKARFVNMAVVGALSQRATSLSSQGVYFPPKYQNRRNLITCQGTPMKSAVVKRSVLIGGHKTSVSLEDEFWNGLKEIAKTQHASL